MTRKFSNIAVFVVCLASVSLADDFKTTNGKEYKNVTVSRQEPDGIFVTNAKAGVMVKLYFAELPKEVQERFGYKPEKAAAYPVSATSGIRPSPKRFVTAEAGGCAAANGNRHRERRRQRTEPWRRRQRSRERLLSKGWNVCSSSLSGCAGCCISFTTLKLTAAFSRCS